MGCFRWIIGICALLPLLSPRLAQAESGAVIKGEHVRVSWIVPTHFSGAIETIGIRFEIQPQWHIYWKNPGDSGTAPHFHMTSSSSEVGPAAWPVPQRFLAGGLTTIAYEGEVVFPFVIIPKAGASILDLNADLEWLVCKEECRPGSGQLTLKRPIAMGTAAWNHGESLEKALQNIPQPAATMPWTVRTLTVEGEDIVLSLLSKKDPPKPLTVLQVFPVDTAFLSPAEPRRDADGEGLRFKKIRGMPTPQTLSFVLVDDAGAWEFTHDLSTANLGLDSGGPTVPSKMTSTESMASSTQHGAQADDWASYLLLLLSAFVGGIILNLMPCVLPVLSIKFFSLAKVSQETRWREAMLYTLGVLLTFTALGGIFLGLRAGGAAIGWGFQLQSPPVVAALIVLFWMMGLSFVGYYEFGNSLTRAAGKFENTGSFATGCLSVFIATPCTGPFMGTALGAAVTLPAHQALLIFFALGLGLASPFLVLAWFPHFKLPRPGQWMITLRQFLAFPLFATVVWLLWVLGIQLGTDAWLYLSGLGLLLTFAIWLGKGRGNGFRTLGLLMALLGIGYTGRWVVSAALATAKVSVGSSNWLDYDPALLSDSAAKKQGVFVDFTASWCVTCQVNKKVVLETDAAEKLFAKNNVRLIRGDWTNLDDKITIALAAFDRASVPLYLYYPPDGSKPRILPQILTLSDIEGLFSK